MLQVSPAQQPKQRHKAQQWQRNRQYCQQHRAYQIKPVQRRLLSRLCHVLSKQLVVAAVCFERHIENVSEQGYRACEGLHPYVQHHARHGRPGRAKLDRSMDDVDRDHGIDQIADSRNEPDYAGKSEAKPAGQNKGVIKPAGQGLYVGYSRIYDFPPDLPL